MTSSRTINRGVSLMTELRRYGHTQTLSHKTHRSSSDGFIVGFARRALRYEEQTTSPYGGGHRDPERIFAFQSSSIRHQREDSRRALQQPQQAQHQLSHRLDTQVSTEDTHGQSREDVALYHRGTVLPDWRGDVGVGDYARPRSLVRGRNAQSQTVRDCQANQRVFLSRDAKDALGSSTARLCQAVEEVEGSLGERLLLWECRARQPRCGEALHLGAAAQAQCVRVLDIRRHEGHDEDWRLHAEQVEEVV